MRKTLLLFCCSLFFTQTQPRTISVNHLLLNYYQTKDTSKKIDVLFDLHTKVPQISGQVLKDMQKEFGQNIERGIRDKIIALATQSKSN